MPTQELVYIPIINFSSGKQSGWGSLTVNERKSEYNWRAVARLLLLSAILAKSSGRVFRRSTNSCFICQEKSHSNTHLLISLENLKANQVQDQLAFIVPVTTNIREVRGLFYFPVIIFELFFLPVIFDQYILIYVPMLVTIKKKLITLSNCLSFCSRVSLLLTVKDRLYADVPAIC